MPVIGEPLQRPDVIAAQRGGDPEQGMTGEPEPRTAALQEARFWLDAYAEILTMEEQVIARVHELMATQSPEVRREAAQSNLPVLTAQVDRFRLRHQVWTLRVAELR